MPKTPYNTTPGDQDVGADGIHNFDGTQVSASATAGGGAAIPATVTGFIVLRVGGVTKKIPYYNV